LLLLPLLPFQGAECFPVFMQSGLDEALLKLLWDLWLAVQEFSMRSNSSCHLNLLLLLRRVLSLLQQGVEFPCVQEVSP
jgi:hypothetical protein